MTLLKKKKMKINAASNFLSPLQARIFNMSNLLLLKHFALIMMKRSRMSAEERRIVENRVAYLHLKGTITDMDIETEIELVKQIIANEDLHKTN